MIFDSRTSAGKLLGAELAKQKIVNPHVFALVRGGVPVAVEVAKTLKAPLDLVVVRKLGVPIYPELGFGAIAPDGNIELDPLIVQRYLLNVDDMLRIETAEKAEIDRRTKKYGVHEPGNLSEQTAILVDDGIATGATMIVAAKYLKKFEPSKLIVAVPLCPDTAESQFHGIADKFFCLSYEEYFGAVGEFYKEFSQVSDEEVLSLIKVR